ncbi:MAG: hypothetical protein K1X94_19115 [Sandaracinaceae bacterium]|nr:hypothetical protein [Sandaracinaceae bacterium]
MSDRRCPSCAAASVPGETTCSSCGAALPPDRGDSWLGIVFAVALVFTMVFAGVVFGFGASLCLLVVFGPIVLAALTSAGSPSKVLQALVVFALCALALVVLVAASCASSGPIHYH